MKKTNYLWRLMVAATVPAIGLTACSDANPDPVPTPGSTDGKFVFATQAPSSNGSTANILVTGDAIDNGELTVIDNGLVNDGATQWVFYKDYLYALTYNQGNAGTTRSYILGEDGQMQPRDMEYNITRFSSYGMYDDYIITTSTGDGPEQFADAKDYRPQTLLIGYLDVVNEQYTTNNTASGKYSVENYLGNGEYVTLSGAEQSGTLLYSGVIPMGLSQYGVADGDGKWVRPGNDDLVNKASGGQGGGAYKAGTLNGTQYPDECWVAIYDNKDMLNPTLVKTDKISYPAGRFRSQYYQTVWAADNGDIYVFSPSYAKAQTDPRQKTTLPAGVCRIPKGSKSFDNYYVNLEAQSKDGKTSFMRCWPAGGNCFILQMYAGPIEITTQATELAIFDADTQKLTYVTGLPEVSSFGKCVYTHNGKVYIPVNVENGYPAIYGIDTKTAVATKGVTINATDINGFGFMTPKK